MRERDVEKYLVKFIEMYGGLCLKFSSPGRRNVPDRICLLPGGRLFFVECKAPGKKPTGAQLREHERLRRLGFVVVVVDSKDDVRMLRHDIEGPCLWLKNK